MWFKYRAGGDGNYYVSPICFVGIPGASMYGCLRTREEGPWRVKPWTYIDDPHRLAVMGLSCPHVILWLVLDLCLAHHSAPRITSDPAHHHNPNRQARRVLESIIRLQ